MIASIFNHELRSKLKSVLTWSVALISLIVVFMAIFPSFAADAALLNDMMARFPPELLAAFGMGNMDLTSVLGYYSFLLVFVQLCLAIQASTYGFGLVSIEEAELTADFLLTRPVSRVQVLTSKLLATLTAMRTTSAVVWGASLFTILAFTEGRTYDTATLLLLFAGIFIFQLFFLGVGLVVSLLVKRVRTVTPYALGLAFGAYVLNAFSGVFGDVKLELITPFKHFDAAYIVANASYNLPLVALNVAVTVIALAASYFLYMRRDIAAVS